MTDEPKRTDDEVIRESGFYYVEYKPGDESCIDCNWNIRLRSEVAFYARFQNPKLSGGLWYTVGSEIGTEERQMNLITEPIPVPCTIFHNKDDAELCIFKINRLA